MSRAPLAAALLVAATASSEDWPQWRGPERTGVLSEGAPAAWPAKLAERFRVEVGLGHSSPVVSGGSVFVFSREDDSEVLRSIALETGDVRWRTAYEAPYRMNPAATGHGPGPKSTPLVSGGRVFTLGIGGMLTCFDAGTGRVVWQSDFRDRFAVLSPLYGHALSPLLAGGKLVVHVGGPGRGALMALAPDTGAPVWSLEGDGPGYSSPMVFDLGEGPQVVTQGESRVVGVSLDSGELLWSLPFSTPYDQNIFTTVRQGDRLLLSGLDQPTRALAIAGGAPHEAWRSDVTFYMSTPVLLGDRLVGFSNKRRGQFVALDARTGATLWTSEGREGDNAALVVWGPWLLFLTDEATLHVLSAGASSFVPERSYEVATSPTWAHPVPTARGILVKDVEHLTLWAAE